jgi:2-hydroxychromene-2-carboxylate isomerase
MTKSIDYYFTPISPFVYLGHERLRALARENGATINVLPSDYGKIFPVSGGLPLKQRAPQRQAYRFTELARWSAFLGLPLNPTPKHFPVPGDLAAKWILAAKEESADAALDLTGGCLAGVWKDERDISDAATLAQIADERGLDSARLAARASDPDIARRYDEATQSAIDRQVFGAPTFIYRDELFWGQDRLDFLGRALAQ